MDSQIEQALDFEAEEEARLMRGLEAESLLRQPLIDGFFKARFHACWTAFKSLPLGATLEEYQTVHHEFRALEQLRGELQRHIENARHDQMRNEMLGGDDV
jgi:hypothetical protein